MVDVVGLVLPLEGVGRRISDACICNHDTIDLVSCPGPAEHGDTRIEWVPTPALRYPLIDLTHPLRVTTQTRPYQ
ncbi:MAG: hypothetical protein ACI8X5_003540 [Planctomycetota bacterium]|jgi:hypothetical protein